ncbi:hypothetical protein FSARC_10384 [Fusarium sarcochroum]|uniref:Uncharacterized protein n=1 Tax=Fusarium sarcochroum TaxID=1208366 RepID=A0A8H4X461_9HYPO|nr:hypothetical protein FSARC_10384 [Fusarium sarcochroum]
MSQRRDYRRLSSASDLTSPQQSPSHGYDPRYHNIELHSLIRDGPRDSRRSTPRTNTFPTQGRYTTELRSIRRPTSPLTLWHLFLDILFAVPALAFLVFAFLVRAYDGVPVQVEPVPTLHSIATYSPTVFPIAFAAAIVNFLKSVAGWKLERGISVLSLEFLLSSRTVFSTLASLMAIWSMNALTPLLIALWALSPLGGQAALRVVGTAPSTQIEPWTGRYVEFRGDLPFQKDADGVPHSLPAVVATFGAALSSPNETKVAGQDTFGHVKIPMLEAYEAKQDPDDDGWFPVKDHKTLAYASISGIPIATDDAFSHHSNYSFNISTSYMRADCKVKSLPKMDYKKWVRLSFKQPRTKTKEEAPRKYQNGLTMAIEVMQRYNDSDSTPMKLNFTSYTSNAITEAICSVKTTYVVVGMACHNSECHPTRVRAEKTGYDRASTVLNGLGPEGDLRFYDQNYWTCIGYLVNATNTMWDWGDDTNRYSSPVELYLTNPDIPYAVLPNGGGWLGEDIWPIGNALFSERFTQLLNSFWLAQIAPFSPMGRVNISTSDALKKELETLEWRNLNGTRTPNELVLRARKPWLATLIISSLVMAACALSAAMLNLLRRGPDILDYATSMIRDNPYVNVEVDQECNSMEDGVDRTRRLMSMKVRLGDVCPEDREGYIAVSTPGRAKPLATLGGDRVFR